MTLPSEAAVRPTYSAPAVEKAFDVFELLADTAGGLTVTDIAFRLNRSLGELFRIVMVMERRGFLQRDPATDRMTVTYKLLDLAYRATPAQQLVRVASPMMYGLVRRVEQSCHLVTPNRGQGLVVAREENPSTRGFSLKLGAAVDLVRSCSGNVILAFSAPEHRERMISDLPPDPAFDRADLDRRLTAVRTRGHDMRASPITHGVTDISYPIFAFDGVLVAALTIPFLQLIDGSQTVGMDDARSHLAETAEAISKALGASQP